VVTFGDGCHTGLSGIDRHPEFTLWNVLSGEVILELAGGAERALRPGDAIARDGTAAAGRIAERS
jgi:uncharacterized cupin superfamily protein